MTNKTLSDKRMELFRKMCKILPDFNWCSLFKEIQNQDKEFIKELKEWINEWEYYEKRFPHKETKWNRIKMRVDKLAGEKLR